jgi:ribose 5-phosphate isomerase B
MLETGSRVLSVEDMGVQSTSDDRVYAHIAVAAARRIAGGEADRGLPLCGTGLGVAIAANRVQGVRAVTAYDSYSVAHSVLSNNAQVLALGERVISLELAKHLVDDWLNYRFDPRSPSAAKMDTI